MAIYMIVQAGKQHNKVEHRNFGKLLDTIMLHDAKLKRSLSRLTARDKWLVHEYGMEYGRGSGTSLSEISPWMILYMTDHSDCTCMHRLSQWIVGECHTILLRCIIYTPLLLPFLHKYTILYCKYISWGVLIVYKLVYWVGKYQLSLHC